MMLFFDLVFSIGPPAPENCLPMSLLPIIVDVKTVVLPVKDNYVQGRRQKNFMGERQRKKQD